MKTCIKSHIIDSMTQLYIQETGCGILTFRFSGFNNFEDFFLTDSSNLG